MHVVNYVTFESQTQFNSVVNSYDYVDVTITKISDIEFMQPSEFSVHYTLNSFLQKPSDLFKHIHLGNGTLKGATFLKSINSPFKENKIELYFKDSKISETVTIDGLFAFTSLNQNLKYDIKATPLDNSYNPRLIVNMQPQVTNESFKFLFYCLYDKTMKVSTTRKIRTVTYDTRGLLQYSIDNPPIGVSIDEMGVITVNINTIGDYEFTVNCSDDVLELTKSFTMQLNVTN